MSGREWNRAHPEKMREASARHRAKHPEYVKKNNARPGRHRVSRYGLNESEFAAMLVRQGYRCLGCQRRFDTVRMNIDHDHKTNRVRGILCHGCNAALGLLSEDKATLTRLRAYLDYDRLKLYVYIIGALKNPRVPEVAARIREKGFEVRDEWHSAGPDADDHWQRYEQTRGHSFAEALQGLPAQNTFFFDQGWIDLADIGIMIAPTGRSGHLEFGYMVGQGKPVYILQEGEDPPRFDIMPRFSAGVYTNLEDLIAAITT